MAESALEADVIVVGAGLAGLVAATDLADAGRSVLILDQEPETSLGGQAHWSFGGLFMVNTPEQRRLGIRDTHDLALRDWMASAEFTDDENDHWPRQWAEAYVDFAAGEMRSWLRNQEVKFFPVVQWVEKGGYGASGPGSSVPRFHITWGTGPGILAPFIRRVRAHEDAGRVRFAFRHRVDELPSQGGSVTGAAGATLDRDGNDTGSFEARAQAVLIASGGIGGNHDLVRKYWPEEWGHAPDDMLQGVPDHVDGRMLLIAEEAGGHIVNIHRMWNYPEAIPHHTPIWSKHAVRLIVGPSTLWLDATGRRLPPPLYPLFDTYKAFEHIVKSGHGHSWFLTNQRIIGDEFSLSGSAHNPDLTSKSVKLLLKRASPGPFTPVAEFMQRTPDFVTADNLRDLVTRMNALTGENLVDEELVRDQVVAYDRQISLGYHNDPQQQAVAGARNFRLDRVLRISGSQRIIDPSAMPLVAIRLRILTRKSLGGLETDLHARVMRPDGTPLAGVYAAGEVAGFGGGGVHGIRSMEGTFLGGCLHSGRRAARGIDIDM